MALSGYFTDGKPSPGTHSPLLSLPNNDIDDLPPKQPTTPPKVKNYDTMEDNMGGKNLCTFKLTHSLMTSGQETSPLLTVIVC